MDVACATSRPRPIRWGQRFDYAAVSNRLALAAVEPTHKLTAQRLQIGNLAIDLDDVARCNRVHLGTWPVRVIRKAKKLPNLIERKPQVARALDERQAAEMCCIIYAVIASAPPRHLDELFRFVEADRLNLQTGDPGDVADFHDRAFSSLDLLAG